MALSENVFAKAVEAGGKLTVRSALNPILWLCAIITIPSLIAMSFLVSIPNWLVWLACAPVVAAIFGFLFLLVFDRDKLQSEEYQLQKKSLELMQQKGEALPSPIDTLAIIETPSNQYIQGGDK